MQPNGNGYKKGLHFLDPPKRVVSLVPSMTESMFDLGFGQALVGITDYCVHPAGALGELPRLGGPKNPNLSQILDLHPDLVLGNQEENTPKTVHDLEAAGVKVWVTFPKTVREALDILWTLTGLFHSQPAALRLETLERTLEWSQMARQDRTPTTYFCPIWQETAPDQPAWWMTFNQDTYCSDLLAQMGGSNIFASRQRRYPLAADLGQAEPEAAPGRDTRYPRIQLREVIERQPEIILLPSEPFGFTEENQQQILEWMADTPAVRSGHVHRVDGSLITWHGTRLGLALDALQPLFA
jgi:iron complex transport system substrate-binding protein